jgi:lipoate-protein ligase A
VDPVGADPVGIVHHVGRWDLAHVDGTVAELHGRDIPPLERPTAWVCRFTDAALVLGSAQGPDVVDEDVAARDGLTLVRRRSGGGAVLLVPGDVLWVDLLVPAGDPLWRDDVIGAAGWVGDLWAGLLEPLLPSSAPRPAVHRGGLVTAPWSGLVCFAGLGAGEVTLGEDGPKLVGVSQRRTRAAARFQCAVLLRWDPARLLASARLDAADCAEALAAVLPRAVGLAEVTGRSGDDLADVLLAGLPAALR